MDSDQTKENLRTEPAPSEAGSNGAQATPDSEAKLLELETKLKEEEKKYLYLYAEFENYKKRLIKERSDLLKFGWEPVAQEILDVVDNLERALEHANPETDKGLVDGLHMILKQFKETLERRGVQSIEAQDKDFDPNLHEAIAHEHGEVAPGKVSSIHRKGYTLHGRLLRPARVVISKGKAEK